MSTSTKVKICAGLAAVLGFLGTISTPLCSLLPAPWQSVCVLGGKAAETGAVEINKNLPDAGR